MKTSPLAKSSVYFEGINFMNTTINEIVMHNIADFLKTNHRDLSKDSHILPNGLKIHKISRAGYRIIELGKDINNDQKFIKFLSENRESIYKRFYYSYTGHFTYKNNYYLIVSKENYDSGKVEKVKLVTQAMVIGVLIEEK